METPDIGTRIPRLDVDPFDVRNLWQLDSLQKHLLFAVDMQRALERLPLELTPVSPARMRLASE